MKRICLICEGCYPYITGGVSSWVDQLIRLNEDYEFYIISLIPNKEFAQIKYELPKNIIGVKDVILNQFIPLKDQTLSLEGDYEQEKKLIKKVLNYEERTPSDILECIEYFHKFKNRDKFGIITKKSFWDAISEYYKEQDFSKGFNLFYWTYRNLFFNLISLGDIQMPEADIYHSVSTGYAGILTSLVNYREKGKTLITEHGIYSREREEDIISSLFIEKDFKEEWIEFFNMLSKTAYEYSDRLITLFDYSREYQLQKGAKIEKTFVIPNGIDLKVYEKIEREKRDIFSIGAVLRVVPIKDVLMMLKGFKLVLKEIEQVHLYIIGPTDEDKDYYEECLELVKDLKMEEYVTFTGATDVKKYYKFIDLFLLTSISEGQPLSLLEAMSCKIPCIATNVGSCKDILIKEDIGAGGIIISPTAYKDLKDSILYLYRDPILREELGENGKKIVENYYSKEAFITSYRKLYKELLEEE